MKKIIIIALILILATTFVNAADFDIGYVKVYDDNTRVSYIDEDGGDIEVDRDSLLEFVVRVKNNLDKTSEAKLYLSVNDLDDSGDILKEIDWYNVPAKTEFSKTISFVVPSDANYESYDADLIVYYKDNNSNTQEIEIDYNIDVRKPEIEQDSIYLQSVIMNYTEIATQSLMKADKYFEYVNKTITLQQNLTYFREQYGRCNDDLIETKNTYDEYKNSTNKRIIQLENNLNDKDGEILTLQNQIRTMVSTRECNNITETKIKEIEDSNNNMMLLIFAIGAGIFAYTKYSNKNKSVAQAMNDDDEYELR
jgi:hypothetical protein